MDNEWDIRDNSQQAIDELREVEHQDYILRWERERAEEDARRQERRRARGYFVPPGIDDDTIIENFPYLSARLEQFNYYGRGGLIAPWLANKLFYVCHNCGCIAYKLTNDISELFKCSGCRSRNITVLRAGEMSMAIRNSGIGTDMREVFNERQERIRAARAERVTQRRNNQRET